MEFAYDGGGLGKGGTVTLYVDGEQVGEGRVDATVPMVFSADETLDVGSRQRHARVRRPRPAEGEFNGRVRWVQIDIGDDAADADHLITPEERFRDRDEPPVGRRGARAEVGWRFPMPDHDVILRQLDGSEAHRLVSWPGELDVGHSFTLDGDEWVVVAEREPDAGDDVRSGPILVCEQRRT